MGCNRLLFVFISFLVFTTCGGKPDNQYSELPIENFYILEIGGYYDLDSVGIHLIRFVEIDKEFKTTIISRKDESESYCSDNIELPDGVRSNIINIIGKYHNDSVSYLEGYPRIYDGPAYMFILERGKEDKICLRNVPYNLPEDLNDLHKYFFNDSLLNRITNYIPNQDSIINRIRQFDLMEYAMPPQFYMHYIMNGYKCVPPVTPTHSDTMMWKRVEEVKFIPPEIIE